MDLYRYFHPHHNPRLRKKALRLHELNELALASKELLKSLQRAKLRTVDSPIGPIKAEHFDEIILAAEYILESLNTIEAAHPGDKKEELAALLTERKNSPGWENWCELLKEKIKMDK